MYREDDCQFCPKCTRACVRFDSILLHKAVLKSSGCRTKYDFPTIDINPVNCMEAMSRPFANKDVLPFDFQLEHA